MRREYVDYTVGGRKLNYSELSASDKAATIKYGDGTALPVYRSGSAGQAQKLNRKYTYEELLKEYPDFDWNTLFSTMNVKVKEISISQPSAVKEAIAIINDTPIDQIKTYIKWQLINSASSYLSDDFSAQNFAFFGKIMSGSEEQSPRWKRAVNVVNGSLGMAVGKIYCDKYFLQHLSVSPPECNFYCMSYRSLDTT